MTTTAQQAIADAVLNHIGPVFGIGGDTWDVFAPSAPGVGAVTYSASGEAAGYILRQQMTRPAQAGPAVAAGAESWCFYSATAAVAPGRIIVSQAIPTLAYLIGTPLLMAGYYQWQATPTAPPAEA